MTAFRYIGHDKDHTGHFNNIKGLNTHKTALSIAQVGLNRKPPADYLTLDLARNEDVRTQLIADTESEGPVAAMNNARKALNYSKDTMTRHVLADMEQNLYRGIIRNADNTQPFTYYVFFDHAQYEDLIKEMHDRYDPLGAKIETVKRSEIEAFKPKSLMVQRIEAIEAWLKEWDGKAIRQSSIYKALKMSRDDFNNMLTHEKAKDIKLQLDEFKKKAKDAGHPMGWIVK